VDVPKGTPGAVAYRSVPGATGPHQGYSPANLAAAYKLVPDTRTNLTVAVVDAYDDPRIVHELNTFDRHYGLPTETRASFRRVDQTGGADLPRTDWDWAGEIALDVQAVRATCNKCKILLVEAKDAATKNLAAAVNTAVRLGADIVSNSYGGPEAGVTRATELAYRHPGVVITAATGDDGWYSWDFVDTVDSLGQRGMSDDMPNAPASLPSVVAVGGTTLRLNADGTRTAETVWNSNGPDNVGPFVGASGGGCSLRFKAPAWQLAVAGYAKTGCGSKRLAGDVSAVGDPRTGFSVYAPDPGRPGVDSWQVFGGTSLAAPLVAGMYGLAGGSGGVRYTAQSLYLNYQYHPGWAHDVREGGTGYCGGDSAANCSLAVRQATLLATGNPNNLADSQGNWLGLLDCGFAYDGSEGTRANNTQCNAAPGYDGPSGVGTVNGVRLLRSAQPSVQLAHPHRLRAGVAQIYRAVRFVDTIGTPVRYVFRWGDGTPPTRAARWYVRHRFAEPGRYVVRVSVVDSLGRTATAAEAVRVHAR
jgi:subtilase family serine protease